MKILEIFKRSAKEFKKTETITYCAMLGAMSIGLSYFSLNIGNYLRIGFSGIVNQLVSLMMGPSVSMGFGAALDLIKYYLKPTGPYFPGFTFTAFLACIIYGVIYYKKPINIWRIMSANLIVAIVCNILLNTLWISILYSEKAFFVILPARIIKNLIMVPVDSMIFYTIAKFLYNTKINHILSKFK